MKPTILFPSVLENNEEAMKKNLISILDRVLLWNHTIIAFKYDEINFAPTKLLLLIL